MKFITLGKTGMNVYKPSVLRKFLEDSLKNMNLECLDLIQLHCPPIEVYYRPEIFELFDTLKQEGKILHFGVCVEKVEEAMKAIEFVNVGTVQIIFNMFRHRPAELFFKEAKKKNVGIIARVPLASGMLTRKSGCAMPSSGDAWKGEKRPDATRLFRSFLRLYYQGCDHRPDEYADPIDWV